MSNQITKSIIIEGLANHIYELWADVEKFPDFMKEIESVQKMGDHTCHWVMAGPFGTTIEWDTETTRMEVGKRIAWTTIAGDIKTSGQVIFTPLPQAQTEVTVVLHYVPSVIGLNKDFAVEFFSDAEDKLLRELRNFKAYAEEMPDRIAA